MDQLKEILSKWLRPFVSKAITRFLLWGIAFLCAKLAVEAPKDQSWVTSLSEWVATVVCVGLAGLVDYFHHKADKKPANTTGNGLPTSDAPGQ